MEYHVINQVVSGLEVESRALIEDIVRANRQTTLIIGSNHCGKSYLLTQLFNCDRSRIKMFQCGGPHNTEHIIFDRERNLYELWRRVFYARNDYMCMNAPCGAGKAVVTVDETGDIYPCSLTL